MAKPSAPPPNYRWFWSRFCVESSPARRGNLGPHFPAESGERRVRGREGTEAFVGCIHSRRPLQPQGSSNDDPQRHPGHRDRERARPHRHPGLPQRPQRCDRPPPHHRCGHIKGSGHSVWFVAVMVYGRGFDRADTNRGKSNPDPKFYMFDFPPPPPPHDPFAPRPFVWANGNR